MVSERVKGQIDRLLDDGEDASAQRDWEGGRGRTQHVRTFAPQSFGGLAFLAAAARSLAGASGPSPEASFSVAPSTAPSEPLPTSPANDRCQANDFLGNGRQRRPCDQAIERHAV